MFGRDPAAFQARLHQAAEAIFIQLAHGAAGVDGDFVGCHLVDDGLPRQADRAQGVGGRDDGHLQAARVKARGVQLAGLEAGRQLAGGFHRQVAVAVDLDVAAVVEGDLHVVVVQCFHRPVAGQRFRQLLAQGDKAQRLAGGAGDREVFLPGRGVHIQVILLDPAHQGGRKNLRTEAFFQCRQVQRLAVVVVVLAVAEGHQLHQDGQAGEGFLTVGRAHRFDHRAAETVVGRAATGSVIATKTNNHR